MSFNAASNSHISIDLTEYMPTNDMLVLSIEGKSFLDAVL
jgi:hypothetical protein